MNTMNKRLFLMTLMIALFAVITACGGQSENNPKSKADNNSNTSVKENESEEKIKLTMWSQFGDPNSTDGGFVGFFKALEATKAQFPNVEIEHVGVGGEAYKTKIKAASASNELPDIFYAWGGGFSQPFITGNRVLAIDELGSDGTLDQLVAGTTDNFTFDGKLYGLPINIATAQLYVNTELFEQAGAKIPETWDELVTAIDVLNAKGIQPIALGAKDRWPAMFWNAILSIRTGGVKTVNAALTKTGSFDTPEFVEAAAKFKQLIDANAFGVHFAGTSYDDATNKFLSGNAAMMYMGAWVNGQIEAEDSLVKGKIVPIKFPVISGGKGSADDWFGGSGETFLINAEVKNKEKVWEVYKFFIKTMSKEVYLAGAGSPAWIGEAGDTSQMNPLAVEIGQLASSATGFSYWWDQMLAGNETESMFSALLKFISGKTSPEEYVQELQKTINSN
ncbi:ABC transporter substrate-binding protein [Paenibacillus sp. SYP-B4298]|uniref:ABC transporter substrate-binding protein n=1 Tax=Paenibacillus sp. SYP-B4298 TaxID=2996034 RepID=UPI0022DD943D|nr:extracellular solute-binding protein [Paenibacillus sp. SYP-B4298]